jgi:hypothetical protein
MGMEIVTRAEAKARGLKQYFTGEPCKNGHVAYRDTQSGSCRVCRNEKKREKRESLRIAEGRKARYRPKDDEDRRRHLTRYKSEWFNKNKERNLKRINEWREKNKEKVSEARKRYRERHPVEERLNVVKRRASKMSRTPKWADQDLIKFFYATRAYMSAETGSQWHVDHIVPLRGKTVSGLHNHFNLRVVPAESNMKKGNRFEQ